MKGKPETEETKEERKKVLEDRSQKQRRKTEQWRRGRTCLLEIPEKKQ